MAARTVEYIVSLIDKYSAVAAKIADSSAKAAVGANAMGTAVNKAEAALSRIKPPPALAGLPGQFERAAAGANKLAAATNTANAALAKANAAAAATAKGANNNKTVVAGGGGDKLGKGLMAWLGGDMALHAIDGVVSKAAEVDTMMEKIRYALGGDQAGARRAYDAAFSMSGKYKNTTVAENLHIIDDLRANLPHSMDEIIKHDLEPFVQLHSFFKAWEGGKHSGNMKSSMKDIATAIRSGELLGNVSGDDIAKHAQALATGRVVFGEKFNVSAYFQAQKSAAAALAGADDTFKNIDFNVLTQRLGPGAGVGLKTLHAKLVGGIMTKNIGDAWNKLGLVERKNVKFLKDGRIDPKSLVGTDWIKGGALWGSNPTDAIMTILSPALANVAGLQAMAGMKDAWSRGDIDKLVEINKKIDRNKLSKALAGLGYDSTAVRQIEETILGAAGLMRSRQQWQQVLKDFKNFQSYDQAKQAFSVQVDRLFQGLTGRTFVPWITSQINTLAGAVGGLADKVHNNPLLRGTINTAASVTGILAVGRALRWITGSRRLGALGPLGAALYIGSEVAANWDAIANTIQRLVGIDIKPMGILAAAIRDVASAFASMADGDSKDWDSIFNGGVSNLSALENARRWFRGLGGQETWGVGPRFSPQGYMDQMHAWGVPGLAPNQSRPSMPPNSWGSGLAGGSINVTTRLEPITINPPPAITIHVTGTVNGTVQGDGKLPLSATAPRGSTTATQVPGPPSGR